MVTYARDDLLNPEARVHFVAAVVRFSAYDAVPCEEAA